MDLLVRLLAGGSFGLACGLNATLPLLVLAVVGLGHKTTLYSPFEFIGTWPAVMVLALLVGLEIFVDKLPNLQRLNVIYRHVACPLAGGIGCAALISPDLLTPVVSFLIGAGLAEVMLQVKNNLRVNLLKSNRTTRLFEPFISLSQDFIAVIIAVLAITVPAVATPISLLVVAGLVVWQIVLRRKNTGVVQPQ